MFNFEGPNGASGAYVALELEPLLGAYSSAG